MQESELVDKYHYASLTKAVADKASPLRQYLERRFPNTAAFRSEYRARKEATQGPPDRWELRSTSWSGSFWTEDTCLMSQGGVSLALLIWM
jgi:hypothetical protein